MAKDTQPVNIVGPNGTPQKVNPDGSTDVVQVNVEQTVGGVLPSKAVLMGISDGANIRAMLGNTQGTLLASAAGTAARVSADQTNYNAKGVILILDITVASGTGGLIPRIQIKDPVSGNYVNLNVAPTAVTATGSYAFELSPGASTAGGAGAFLVNQRTAGSLPRLWRVSVSVGDATSYTYSVGYSLIL